MSEQQTVIGKLKKIEKIHPEETKHQMMGRILNKNQMAIEENVEEQFWDYFYDTYVYADEEMYIIKHKIENDYGDIAFASEKENGEIDFVVSYYNGGCDLTEALETALENMKNK